MKTINLFTIVTLALFCTTYNAHAQFYMKRKAIENSDLKNATIYVKYKELSDRQIEKFKKRNLLNEIKGQYDVENNLLKNTINDIWYPQNSVKKLSSIEINNKISNGETVWYISLDKHYDKFFDRRIHKRNIYYNYAHYKLALYKNKKEILSVRLVSPGLSSLDLQFALNSIQRIINEKDSLNNPVRFVTKVNSNAGLILEKTLLVSENTTAYSQEYLQQFFKGKIKIVSEKEILQAIRNKDSNYAYLMVTINDHSDEPSFNYIILNCENNRPLLVYRNSTAYVKPCNHTCIIHQKNERPEYLLGVHFKQFQKIINKSI